jgi:integrase
MPKLVFRLPKYSFHKSSGQAKVRFNGKTTYLGKYGSTESKEAFARFIESIPKPPEEVTTFADPVPGVVPLIGEIVPRYLAHAKVYYARDGVPTGEHVTVRCALAPLVKRFDALPVTDFGPKKLKLVRDDMIKLGWSRHYCNKAVGIVKRCFTWAAEEELIPAAVSNGLTPVTGLKKGRTAARETEPIGPVADELVEAVIPCVSELIADVVRVMRLTGMRPGEVLAMTVAQIDRSDPTLWTFKPDHHKTAHHGQDRTVFLGPKAIDIVRRYLLKAGDGEKLFSLTRDGLRRAVDRGCERAFPHPTLDVPPGTALDDAMRKELKALRKVNREELKAWRDAHRWHPNQLRHSVGTEVRKTFGLEAAQVVLGHAKANMTETYAERDMAKAAEVARKIG